MCFLCMCGLGLESVHGLGMKLRLEEATFENALVDMHAKCQMIGDARWIIQVSKLEI